MMQNIKNSNVMISTNNFESVFKKQVYKFESKSQESVLKKQVQKIE